MSYYTEVVTSFQQRGNFIPISELPKYIKLAQKAEEPLFASYYLYDSSILEARSVRRFGGKVYPPEYFKLDVDKGNDTDDFTLLKAQKTVEILKKEFGLSEECIGVFFSGRGYHIYFPNIFGFKASPDLPNEVKATFKKFFPDADGIYDKARIIRVANTINTKSGLYKVQLPWDIFYSSVGDIKEYATKAEPLTKIKTCKIGEYESLIVKQTAENIADVPNGTTPIVTCMQHLYDRGPIQGRRHRDLLRLASAWRRNGLSKKAAIDLGTKWAYTLEPLEVTRIVRDVYEKGYSYSCNDPIMQEFCDPKCIFYTHKNYEPEIEIPSDIERQFAAFVTSDIESKILNLEDIYPDIDFKFYPGEFVVLTADTGIGKSAWVQNLCLQWKVPILYLSLEMHSLLTYRRFVQIAHGMTREEVEEYYKKKDFQTLSKPLEHIKIVSTPPTIENIETIIRKTLPHLVVIDVMDAIVVKGKDPDEKLGTLAIRLKELANKLGIIILAIHHISKAAAQNGGITVHALKGSSSIEQKADKVLGIDGAIDTDIRLVKVLKARDESAFKLSLRWDKDTMRFKELTRWLE